MRVKKLNTHAEQLLINYCLNCLSLNHKRKNTIQRLHNYKKKKENPKNIIRTLSKRPNNRMIFRAIH